MGIRLILKLIAIGLIVYIAAPNINKVEPIALPQTEHKVQLVSEVPEPQLVKQEVVQEAAKPQEAPKPKPAQSKPTNKGCEAYRAEVAKYDWNVNVALAIMKAESGCRTDAKGDNRVIGGIYAPSCGLMQIRTLKGRPTCEQLKDPATNIAWAHKLYRASSWNPWSVYKNGMYKKHL